jgi:excisionase family DNA binding protein
MLSLLGPFAIGDTNMDALPAALSVPAASKYLSISRANLYRLIKAGEIARAKIGHRTIIRRIDADAFLERSLTRQRLGDGPVAAKPAPKAEGGIFG